MFLETCEGGVVKTYISLSRGTLKVLPFNHSDHTSINQCTQEHCM